MIRVTAECLHRNDYNQVANYALAETPINIVISNRSPEQYMSEVQAQIDSGMLTLGELTSAEDLQRNLAENAVPEDLHSVTAANYPTFLDRRRKLMAAYIKRYYQGL